MGTQAIFFGDGKTVTGILHLSTRDAVFTLLDGRRVAMEFHPYCGPNFFIGEEWYMPNEDTPEWGNLWRQFGGWWDAKGREQYARS